MAGWITRTAIFSLAALGLYKGYQVSIEPEEKEKRDALESAERIREKISAPLLPQDVRALKDTDKYPYGSGARKQFEMAAQERASNVVQERWNSVKPDALSAAQFVDKYLSLQARDTAKAPALVQLEAMAKKLNLTDELKQYQAYNNDIWVNTVFAQSRDKTIEKVPERNRGPQVYRSLLYTQNIVAKFQDDGRFNNLVKGNEFAELRQMISGLDKAMQDYRVGSQGPAARQQQVPTASRP